MCATIFSLEIIFRHHINTYTAMKLSHGQHHRMRALIMSDSAVFCPFERPRTSPEYYIRLGRKGSVMGGGAMQRKRTKHIYISICVWNIDVKSFSYFQIFYKNISVFFFIRFTESFKRY